MDGKKLDYNHWRHGGPLNDDTKNCVQLVSSLTKTTQVKAVAEIGEWSNTECSRRNFLALCQKLPNLTFSDLKTMLFELKKDFNKNKKELKETIALMQETEIDLKQELVELESRMTSVPRNMIYIQYPHEVEPINLWNCSNGVWKDISSQYSGLFFRVIGGSSAPWGSIQEASSPYFQKLVKWSCGEEGTSCTSGTSTEISTRFGGSSTYYLDVSRNSDFTLDYYHSDDEVKPTNMAIKVWKCSNL